VLVTFLVAAGVGVGAGSDSGGSPAEEEDEEVDVELDVFAADALGPGSTSFKGRREAASVSSTRELAALPMSTPNPRNTSTSSTETLGEGSVNHEARALVRPPAGGGAWGGASAVTVGGRTGWGAPLERLWMRAISSTSWGLRDPTRAPQLRQ